MGSLMAGWDSDFKDPKAVIYQRNKSLTKEEIAAYWKSKSKAEDVNNENQENVHNESVPRIQRSNTMPMVDKQERSVNNDGEKLSKINCWWTRSNSAFLNEPPVMATEGHQKYVAQFNVAQFGSSTPST